VNAHNGESSNSQCVVGEVRLFAGPVRPGDFKIANGKVLQISDYPVLYDLLGTTCGGNGDTTFALPDLRGAEPNGAETKVPNYAICTVGVFPH
jgi:microcystin-dependent protein